MNEFVTVSESKTATAHEIFNKITKEVVGKDIALFYEMCPAKETKYYEELVAKHEKAFLQSVKTSEKYITFFQRDSRKDACLHAHYD